MTIVLCLSIGWPGGLVAQSGPAKRGVERIPDDSQAPRRVGNRWALIVGVDQYQDKSITPLAGAVADAKAIRDALIKYAEFPEAQAILLASDSPVKPTKAAIFEKLGDIRKGSKPGDLLLLYFAGHGVEVDGQRYMLTYDAQCCSAAAIKSSAFLATQLMQELETIKVADRIIMIDACRNDPTKGGKALNVADENLETAFTLQPASEGGLRATFLSSSRGQSAYEWTEKRRGFFSYFIEAGLSGEAAQFGKVTVTSLLTYLNEMVPRSVREQKNQMQIPYTRVDGSELVLVRAEKLPAQQITLDRPAAPSLRTIYGVVKDSAGVPLIGARVTAVVPTAARAVPGKAAQVELTVVSDEDGFFKIDGVEAGADAKITVIKDGYEAKSLSSSHDQAGRKIPVFLPRNAVTVASNAAAPALQPRPAPPVAARAEEPKTAAVPAVAPRPQPGEAKPASTKPVATTARAEEPKPLPVPAAPARALPPETKPAETKPVEAKTAGTKPVETKPATRPVETKPVEPKPVEPKPVVETKPVEPKPVEPKAATTTARTEPAPPKPAAPATPTRGKKPAAATPAAPVAVAPPPPVVAPPPVAVAPPPAPAPVDTKESRAQELSQVAYRTFLAEDFNEAERVARRALEADPENALASAVLGNSIAAMALNANDAAATASAGPFIDKALRRDPNQAIARNALGITLVANKKYDEAANEFKKSIASDARFAAAHANLAYVLLKQAEATKNAGNRLKDAEREYREAIRLEPDSSVPYNGLSTVLFSMGKYKDAVKACREAIGRYQLRDRILGMYYVQMAVAQYQDGHYEEALESVGRAKALGLSQHEAYALIEKGKPQKRRG